MTQLTPAIRQQIEDQYFSDASGLKSRKDNEPFLSRTSDSMVQDHRHYTVKEGAEEIQLAERFQAQLQKEAAEAEQQKQANSYLTKIGGLFSFSGGKGKNVPHFQSTVSNRPKK